MSWPSGRSLWLKVHLYLGLFAGTVLVLLAITGIILVFAGEVDRMLNPGLTPTAGSTPERWVSPDQVYDVIDAELGERPYMLELPTPRRGLYLAFINSGEPALIRSVLVDAGSGRIVANRELGGYFVSFSRKLHTGLLMEDAGAWVVAGVGILGVVSLATGLYLWWPRAGAWRKALKFHWHRYLVPFTFETHRVVGFYLLGVLLVILVSGVYLSVPTPFQALIGKVSPLIPYPDSSIVTPSPAEMPPLSLTQLAEAVERRWPGVRITGFHTPDHLGEAVEVYFRDVVEPDSRFGRSAVWLNPYDGTVIYTRRYSDMSTADRFLTLQFLLHNGEIAGEAGRWTVAATGVVLVVLFGTGIFLWWAKRRPRRRATGRTC